MQTMQVVPMRQEKMYNTYLDSFSPKDAAMYNHHVYIVAVHSGYFCFVFFIQASLSDSNTNCCNAVTCDAS